MKTIQGNELRGHLETMILAILEAEAMHGYEIVRRLEAAGQDQLSMKEGTVYPVLYRLEAAGHISARWEAKQSTRRGPRRRIYRLTPKGKRKLAEGRSHWQTFVTVIGGIVGEAT